MLTGLQNLDDALLTVQQAHPFENLRVFSTADFTLACVVGTVSKLGVHYPQNRDTQFS